MWVYRVSILRVYMIRKIMLRLLARSILFDHLQDIEFQTLQNFIYSQKRYAMDRRRYLEQLGQYWLDHGDSSHDKNEARTGTILLQKRHRYCHCVMDAKGVWSFVVSSDGTTTCNWIRYKF